MEKETFCTFAGNRSAIIVFKSLSVAFHHIHPDHTSSIISRSVQRNLSTDTASLNKGRWREERKTRREEGSNERNVYCLSAIPNNGSDTSRWFRAFVSYDCTVQDAQLRWADFVLFVVWNEALDYLYLCELPSKCDGHSACQNILDFMDPS